MPRAPAGAGFQSNHANRTIGKHTLGRLGQERAHEQRHGAGLRSQRGVRGLPAQRQDEEQDHERLFAIGHPGRRLDACAVKREQRHGGERREL